MSRRDVFRTAILWLLLAPAGAAAQAAPTGQAAADTLRANENLVVQGVPAIPVALAEEAGRYTEFRTAMLWDWHPVRREVLVGTRFADAVQLHRVAAPGGARTQLTFYAEPVATARYEPRTGSYIVFSKDVGGGEFYQLYRYDIATGGVTLLTDGRSRNVVGRRPWSRRGDRISYTSTRRNGADTDIYVMDPARPATDRLVARVRGGGWSVADWSADDRTLLALEQISVTESYLWLVDVATGKMTPIVERGAEKAAYASAQFAPGGRALYVVTDRGSEFLRLASLDIATKRLAALGPRVDWDVEDMDVSPDGRSIAYVTNEDGISRLRVLDVAARALRPVPKLPPGFIFSLRWHRDGRVLGFGESWAHSPADVYSLDVAAGRLDRWTTSETGGLPAENDVIPEVVQWKAFDGRSISGLLYRPPSRFAGPRPVVINIHGGPESQSRPEFRGSANYYINELGVALIYPNVRGSTGYGKTFALLDNGLKRADTYKDVGALLDWIATRPELDARRVMVTGGSYGGHMTLAVATNYNDRICCSVDVVGISNFVTFLENTQSYRRDLRRAEYGDERDPAVRGFFERTAPFNNAAKITKPLFVIQGKNDPRVPLGESEQMVAVVRRQGTPVWYLMAADEGHGFKKKRNSDFQFYATIMFVRRFLLGEPMTSMR